MTLIPSWRVVWRHWSARISALGMTLYAAAWTWPEGALALWNMMPLEVRNRVPEPMSQILAFALFAAVLAAKFIKQKEPSDVE